ncbi:hypothetical protein LPJ64_003653 [Coemansia asiatica]|uniref:NmrA-like domain-containing protein n=1 Tax=Coemansia asiatica TaxID=1052880 RepID=A0A9W7XKQ3_9FUNG|nr:hypothetical protein LPJ64_003653 [Coemansia asiatica]KAJ2868300.1 hypothetical protein FB639_004880 [Coemansia asiatica]
MQTFSEIIGASDYKSVLVTGCDMYSGFSIARTLLKSKHYKHVCAGYFHENALVHHLKKEGANPEHLNVEHAEQIVRAYKKADVVVIVPPVSEHSWSEKSVAYVLAAKEAKVKGLVLCSKINIKEMANMPMLQPLAKMEEAYDQVKDHMKAASLVRCSMHIDVLWLLRHQIASEHKICLPVRHDAKCAPMAEMDGARALCNMLFDPKHKPGVYELTGPETMNFDDIAHQASSAIDSDIGYEQVDHQKFIEYLKHRKEISDNEIHFIGNILCAISDDKLDKQTDDLKKLLGEDPHTVKGYLQKNADDFKPHDD